MSFNFEIRWHPEHPCVLMIEFVSECRRELNDGDSESDQRILPFCLENLNLGADHVIRCEMLAVDGPVEDPLVAHPVNSDTGIHVVEPAPRIVAAEAEAGED